MGKLHSLFSLTYPFLRFSHTIRNVIRFEQTGRLRILLYHDIAPEDQKNFAAQLRWLSKRWHFVSPQEFASMVVGKEQIKGNNLLLSFDDGFASNRVVAENILNPMGIKALFFVVSDFAAIEYPEEARTFIANHICPGMAVGDVPEYQFNMGWDDLEALLEQGHTIGAHTKTHARLSKITKQDDLHNELVTSADTLEQHLGTRIEHFAFTFGNLASFSTQALAVARQRYGFVYSGLRGDNFGNISPFALRRDSITAHESRMLLGAFLEGGADFRYAKSSQVLDQWAGSV
jgi:peptidoglycan/xylan/chitin deacetylase (PgdA/CDA1 family)